MLLEDDVGSFPDCPTERGQKHIKTMQKVSKNHRSIILFLVQHPNAKYFSPNAKCDPIFVKLLQNAIKNGVEIRSVKMYLKTSGEVIMNDANLKCVI